MIETMIETMMMTMKSKKYIIPMGWVITDLTEFMQQTWEIMYD